MRKLETGLRKQCDSIKIYSKREYNDLADVSEPKLFTVALAEQRGAFFPCVFYPRQHTSLSNP